MDPQDEFVQRQARDRGQLSPVERRPGGHRGDEEVGEGNDDDVRIASLPLDVKKPLSAGPSRFIDGHQGLRQEIVFADQRGDEAGHDVCPASRSGWNDELDGLTRRPRLTASGE